MLRKLNCLLEVSELEVLALVRLSRSSGHRAVFANHLVGSTSCRIGRIGQTALEAVAAIIGPARRSAPPGCRH